ncbi:hypothetical protein BJ742DRAFT_260192 [Cladochytrium replicatum]|nr:hypothetical protein BJ742DRAFT_260192 [Cladochytrium replicatum]
MSTTNLPLYPQLQYPSPVHTSDVSHHISIADSSNLNHTLAHASPAPAARFTDSPPGDLFSDKPSFGPDGRSVSFFSQMQQPTWADKEHAAVEHIMVDDDAAVGELQDDVMGEDEEQMRVYEEQSYEEGDESYPIEYEMQPVDEEGVAEVYGADVEVLQTGDVEVEAEYAGFSKEVKVFLKSEEEQNVAPNSEHQHLSTEYSTAGEYGIDEPEVYQHGEVHNGDSQDYVKEGIDNHQVSNPVEQPEVGTASLDVLPKALKRHEVKAGAETEGLSGERESDQAEEHNDTQEYEEAEEPAAEDPTTQEYVADGEQEGEEGVYPDADDGQYPYAGEEDEADPNQKHHEDESANSVEAQYDEETVQDEEPYLEYDNDESAYEHNDIHDHGEEGLHYRADNDAEVESHEAVENAQLVSQQRAGGLPPFVLEYQQTFYCMFSPLPSVPESDVLFLGGEGEPYEDWTVDHLCREIKSLFEIESDVVLEFTNLELSFYEGSQHTSAKLDTLVQMHDALSSSSTAETHQPSLQPVKVLLLECRNSFEKQWQSLNRLLEERPVSRKRMRGDGDEEENPVQVEEYRESEDDVNGATKRPRLEESSAPEQEVQ